MADSSGPNRQRNYVLDRGRDPPWEATISRGCPVQRKALGVVSATVYAAKGIIPSSITP